MQLNFIKTLTSIVLVVIGCTNGQTPCCGAEHETEIVRLESADLKQLLQVTEQVLCGGEPASDDALAELSRRGVRTIVSVDGARPRVARARKFGMRYVHIPIGYDGIDKHAQHSLARVVRETSERIYIHCHHGQHRGPAAAAIAAVASGQLGRDSAIEVLTRAGTSKDYWGLWRDVESFEIPSADAELPPLIEASAVESTAEAMVTIDRSFEDLKACMESQSSTNSTAADSRPHQLALLVLEGLREYRRHQPPPIDRELDTMLRETESHAEALLQSLRQNRVSDATVELRALSDQCDQCHARYRNASDYGSRRKSPW